MSEKLDTEQATTGKLSEGATLVDIRIVSSFIRCSDELYLAVFSTEWPAKKAQTSTRLLFQTVRLVYTYKIVQLLNGVAS